MIHILPPEIANRIAAGEVVERPASVVRELIDNAIDAGASRIDVEIEQGGLHSIRVTDDGCGMSPEDAALCSKRHATSKIRSAADLNFIATKGFRGEALAAISSIAKYELKTRLASAEWGTQIVIEGGAESEPQTIGAAVGTSVAVRDLFYNTPARRKFLKKPATEMNHVLSTITWNALAHENIHFTFAHNNRRLMDIPSVSSRAERIQQVFGKKTLDDMIPVSLDTPALSISGFISRPTLSRNGAQHVFFFVNDRYIKDRLLLRATLNGYRNLIHAGRYPVVFLYLEIDPTEIDINVHPTKQEIKFSHEDAVFSATYGAIRNAWDTNHASGGAQPRLAPDRETGEAAAPESKGCAARPMVSAAAQMVVQRSFTKILNEEDRPISAAQKPPEIQLLNRDIPRESEPGLASVLGAPVRSGESAMRDSELPQAKAGTLGTADNRPVDVLHEEKPAVAELPSTAKPAPPSEIRLPGGAIRDLIQVDKKVDALFDARSLEDSGGLTVLGQFMNSYILAEGREGLYVIDQHAAHERLLFEQFLNQSQKAPLASQTLLFPITLDFPPDEVGLVEEISDVVKSLGFFIEPFGGRTFVVRSIPSSLGVEEAEQFVKDFLGEVRHESSASEYKDKALHTLACRAAVKFGDKLEKPEMEGIINGLQKIPRRNVCPHGRPAILFVAESALLKAFKRTGF